MVQRRKQRKGTQEEEFEEVGLDSSVSTREMVRARKQSDQIKPETFLKRKPTMNDKENEIGEEEELYLVLVN